MQATAYGLQTIFLEFAKRTPPYPEEILMKKIGQFVMWASGLTLVWLTIGILINILLYKEMKEILYTALFFVFVVSALLFTLGRILYIFGNQRPKKGPPLYSAALDRNHRWTCPQCGLYLQGGMACPRCGCQPYFFPQPEPPANVCPQSPCDRVGAVEPGRKEGAKE